MTKAAPVLVTVDRVIQASPTSLYDMVADVTRMGEWSPETVEAAWTKGATGPEVGATFVGKNTLGPNSWKTKPTVTVADRPSHFAFKVPGKSGATWTYTFHPEESGTRVVESVKQDKASPPIVRFFQRRAGVTDRSQNLRESMTETLRRLDEASNPATSI